jgi:LmbE family N-acetylglucosaminyl deacetylase
VAVGSRIAVLSPHLDDAAFSIGAFLHDQASHGAHVTVITVLAGDPETTQPAGEWDARCGFTTAAAAARRRREEDLRACGLLGATPVWLPFPDETYGARPSDDAVWTEVERAIGSADVVLVPGYPLALADHRFVADLAVARHDRLDARLGFYAEQPYAAAALTGVHKPAGGSAGRTALLRSTLVFPARARTGARRLPQSLVLGDPPIETVEWGRHRASRSGRRAKFRAVMSYRSQLRPIGVSAMAGAWLYEALSGGESIGWA